MNRSLILVVLLLFASPLIVAADGPVDANAPEAVAGDLSDLLEAPKVSTLDQDLSPSEEPFFVSLEPTLCTHEEPYEGFCDGFDDSYCDYEWDCECCCVAVWKASGAYCGDICV